MMGWIILFTYIAIEVYVFFYLGDRFKKHKLAFRLSYLASTLLVVGTIVMIMVTFRQGLGQSTIWTNLLMGGSFSLIIAKLFIGMIGIIEEVSRLLRWGYNKATAPSQPASIPSRRKFIANVAMGVAAIPFTSLIYGVLKGKYDFVVRKEVLTFPDLPANFDGFTIAQISDVHSGSFDSMEGVKKGIDMLQEQNPDMILFTGDLVNNFAHEIEPYLDLFKGLQAPHGKFSVLGNHDYGEYVEWPSEEAKRENLRTLMSQHDKMNFKLMNNTSETINIDGQAIRLSGVENWGKPPFPQIGDLDRALSQSREGEFNILMSHDPDHWAEKVLTHERKVHLTLSGHTHGSQMGVEIPGFRFSPVQFRYDRWAGLYKEQDQYLYVNRGFGFIGYPGRAGIWPEITIIELKKA